MAECTEPKYNLTSAVGNIHVLYVRLRTDNNVSVLHKIFSPDYTVEQKKKTLTNIDVEYYDHRMDGGSC